MSEREFPTYDYELQRISLAKRITVRADLLMATKAAGQVPPAWDCWFSSPESVAAGDFDVHFFRHAAGLSPGYLGDFLAALGLEPGRIEHLLLLSQQGLHEVELLPLASFAKGCMYDWASNWPGKAYPLIHRDGSLGTVDVNRKYYNKDDSEWIEKEVTVFGVKRVSP